MAKQCSADRANTATAEIFSSTKSRSIFGVDFGKLDAAGKAEYVQQFFGRTAFKHQVEILDVLTDPFIKSTTTNAARQSGKTDALSWSQALNAIHNLYPALDDTTMVVSLANKESQSLITGSRLRGLLDRNYKHTQFFWDRAGSVKTHLTFKKEAGVNSRTVGTVQYLTANPRAFGEGFTASVINVDEAGRLDKTVYSECIVPYGTSTNAKINLTGVSRGKGVFYDACNSKDYVHLHYPWDKIDTYRKLAPVDLVDRHTGEIVLKTGLFPLKVMPLSLKKVLFPHNPICHILPAALQKEAKIELWELSEGIMTEDDYLSQYCLAWLADLMGILQLEDIKLLFESSEHLPLEHGIDGEEYVFGFDLGGTENMYALGPSNKDSAALAIWTKRNGIKQKVFCDELYSAQPEEAVQWLTHYTHPKTGIFPCKYGAIDVTGTLGALTSEKLVASHLPVIPIMYNRTEETTKKNFKNAMFDYFEIECGAGRIQYPRKEVTDSLDPDTLRPLNPVWFKNREQWEIIERKLTGSINARIMAPAPEHDDGPNSDVLGVYVLDRPQQFTEFLKPLKERAKRPILGVSRLGFPQQGSFGRRW